MPAFIVFVSGIIVWAALRYWLSPPKKLRRALRRARRASIAGAPEGEAVRIDGRVVDGETLIAPLTGRRCVFYVAILEESQGKRGWIECARETRGVPFTVDDGTGGVIVDPAQAQIDAALDSITKSGLFDDPTPVEAAFLKRHGQKPTCWFYNRGFRYCEGVFEVGELISVMCYPVRESDPDAVSRTAAGYRDPAPTRLRGGGSPDHPILLSDASDVTGAREH